MHFTSPEFLIFLPVVLCAYYVLSRRAQNAWLLAASYFFYGWWDWRFCSLLALSTVVDYTCALRIEAATADRARRRWLLASLCANLGILGFFKYFNFFADSAAALLAALGFQPHLPVLRVVLPVGISFYTFQTMSYTIDVYRRNLAPTRSFLDFALFVSFFPQLVAGPIERATNLLRQFAAPRTVTRPMLESGCFLVLVGFFRKLVIADGVAPIVDSAFADTAAAGWGTLLCGALAFSLQIYGDFAGYSDIARGISRLLGIELMVNFRQPYLSRSITEFWRRWHISLSSWLRDYLYIPLGGNRRGTAATYRNLMLTMLLGGLWHGARWNFVIWGGLHGLFLAVHKWFLVRAGRKVGAAPLPFTATGLLATAGTFLLVAFAWIFFRAQTFADATSCIAGIATLRGGLAAFPAGLAAKVAVFAALTAFLDLPAYRRDTQEALLSWPWLLRGAAYAAMFLLIILLRPLDDVPFIYFQF